MTAKYRCQTIAPTAANHLAIYGSTRRYAGGINLTKNKNYISGRSYEQRFVNQRLKRGAVVSKRFYASRGITDVYWVDKEGTYSEAQLKYSSKTTKPYISKQEEEDLRQYARNMPFPVFLVRKSFRQEEEWGPMWL